MTAFHSASVNFFVSGFCGSSTSSSFSSGLASVVLTGAAASSGLLSAAASGWGSGALVVAVGAAGSSTAAFVPSTTGSGLGSAMADMTAHSSKRVGETTTRTRAERGTKWQVAREHEDTRQGFPAGAYKDNGHAPSALSFSSSFTLDAAATGAGAGVAAGSGAGAVSAGAGSAAVEAGGAAGVASGSGFGVGASGAASTGAGVGSAGAGAEGAGASVGAATAGGGTGMGSVFSLGMVSEVVVRVRVALDAVGRRVQERESERSRSSRFM